MMLSKGKYEADLRLGFFEKFASNDTIVMKLLDVGFSNVIVTGSGRDRQASGIWTGDDIEVELPSQVVSIRKL